MTYYKVVDIFNNSTIIDTSVTNYSSTLVHQKRYLKLLDFITKSSENLELPLDMFFSLYNNIFILGNTYIQNIPKPQNGIYRVSDITKNPNHYSYHIQENYLRKIIEYFVSNCTFLFQEGFYLWEYILENVRSIKFKSRPSRLESFFLFEDIANCRYYIKNHKGGGIICKVELIYTKSIYRADMSIIDLISNHCTYREVEKDASRYWDGQTSNEPIIEVLFQGVCKIFQ